MSDPNTIKHILAELRDVNKEKRRTAVMKLGMLGGDQAVRALIRALTNEHEDLIVRGRAALMLGKLRDTRAVDPLIDALDAPGFQTPVYAAQALGEIGDKRALAPLLTLYHEGRGKVRDAATEALIRLGYNPCEEESQTSLPEPQPEV
ncbi:MAG: HEAT repeat domain-containing protein [Chloroflexi bacterium]|nr:HEAT repeat domain-containing protein [Chloroflexota bacterium]